MKNLIGKTIIITDADNWNYGEWAVINYQDEDYYYAAIANDPNISIQLSRNEFKVKRDK